MEIFLCTVEGCSKPPQQSTIFHGHPIKAKREECLREQSINSMQLQVQSHCTQCDTIPPLSGGAGKSSSPETKGSDLLTSSSVGSGTYSKPLLGKICVNSLILISNLQLI